MLNYITHRQKASDNMSGTPLVSLYLKFGIEATRTKLKQLLEQQEVVTRPGINDTLIFLRQ